MGTRKNRLSEAVLTSTHNLCFDQMYEKYPNFYLKIFIFWWLKCSVYLNRQVFVMPSLGILDFLYFSLGLGLTVLFPRAQY